jgi:hypothetical protein
MTSTGVMWASLESQQFDSLGKMLKARNTRSHEASGMTWKDDVT